jgi:hypothetical protein
MLAGVVVLAVLAVIAWQYRGELKNFEQLVEQHGALGAVSVVLLPLLSLPLVPLAARVWGVRVAGALSAAGLGR